MNLTDLPKAITMDTDLTRMTAFLRDVGGYTWLPITLLHSAVQSCMALGIRAASGRYREIIGGTDQA